MKTFNPKNFVISDLSLEAKGLLLYSEDEDGLIAQAMTVCPVEMSLGDQIMVTGEPLGFGNMPELDRDDLERVLVGAKIEVVEIGGAQQVVKLRTNATLVSVTCYSDADSDEFMQVSYSEWKQDGEHDEDAGWVEKYNSQDDE